MAWIDDWLMAVALVALLGCASAVLAWLLRRSGVPGGVQGAAVCAGVFVGLLAGPGVAANAWPGWSARWVSGGTQEARDLADLREQQRDEVAALRTTGVTPVAIEELEERHRVAIEPAQAALGRARAERAAWNDRALLAVSALVSAVGVMCVGRGRIRWSGRALIAGCVAWAVGVVLPWGVMALLGAPASGALALAVGALGAGVGVAGVAMGASSVAMLGAGCVAVGVFGFGMLPVMIGVAVAAIARAVLIGRAARRVRRGALDFLWSLGAPALCALVALRLDLRALDPSSWALWLTLVFALVWCSDGRMGAAWAGLKTVGAGRAWSRSARMVNAGGLVPHLVFTALGASAGLLGQPVLTACVASAVLLGLSVGARRLIAEMIEGGGLSR